MMTHTCALLGLVLFVLAYIHGKALAGTDSAPIPAAKYRSFSAGLGISLHFCGGFRNDVQRISKAGFHVVRSDMLWAAIQQQRERYDRRLSDVLLRQLAEPHLIPLFILAYSNPLYTPRVTTRPAVDSLAYAVPVDGAAPVAYMAFFRAAARRYGPAVIWEIWNEPDHNFGSTVDLRAYIEFAGEARGQLRQLLPNATVIGPAASGFLWWFLRDFIAADGGRCFDAISVDPL